MKMPCRLLLTLVAINAAQPLRAEDKPAGQDRLAVLERFAGEWEVDGKWSDGSSLHARSIYEWGLGKKILKARTFVKDGEREYQRYEGVLAWHPDRKSLFEISFAFDGHVSELLIDSKDKDTLQIGWTPYAADKPQNIRQTIKFLDSDHFQWTVLMKDGDQWKQLIDATWKRKA